MPSPNITPESAAAERSGRPFFKGLPRRVCLSVSVSVLLFLFGLELAGRWLPIEVFALETLDPMANKDRPRIQAHPYASFVLRPNWRLVENGRLTKSHNSLGFRGPESTWKKPADCFRILCLGGSSTYGQSVSSDGATYPLRLEEKLGRTRSGLRIEVINGGAAGYTSFESMTNLASRAIAFEPDIVLVYHGINDVSATLYRSATAPEFPVMPDNTHFRSHWRVPPRYQLEEGLERSRAYLILRRYLTDYAQNQAKLDHALVVDGGLGTPLRSATGPDSQQGFANFERNLATIFSIATAHGAKVVFATQGMDFDDLSRESPEIAETYTAALLRNREIVRRVASRTGGLFLDVAPQLERLHADRIKQGERGIFTSTVHFTDQGAAELARLLAQGIRKAGYLR